MTDGCTFLWFNARKRAEALRLCAPEIERTGGTLEEICAYFAPILSSGAGSVDITRYLIECQAICRQCRAALDTGRRGAEAKRPAA